MVYQMDVVECRLPWYKSYRYLLAVIAFLAILHVYAQRVGVSISIVCMVNQTAVAELSTKESFNSTNNVSESIVKDKICESWTPAKNSSDVSDAAPLDGPFIWDKATQGHILGSYFYGYLVSQVPGGLLAEKFGGKWVFVVSMVMSTAATLLSPIGANTHFAFFIILRVLAGIGSGAVFPCMHAIWSQWAPPQERSKLVNLSYAGAWMGNILTMPIGGLLCQYGFAGGWGSIYYVIGISSVFALLLWIFLVSDTPAKHPAISDSELQYITKSLQGQVSNTEGGKVSTPWLSIFKSKPVWATIIAAISVDWGLYTFLALIPTYFKEVLQFDVSSNGALSAVPFIGVYVSMSICPMIADKIIASKRISLSTTRKVFQGVGSIGAALVLFVLSFIKCDLSPLAVGLLTLAIILSGAQYSGYMVLPMDYAPNFAGTIFGIANGIASVCGFFSPMVNAQMTKNGTALEWRYFFWLTSAIYIAGALSFIFLGTSEIQPWAVKPTSDNDVPMKDAPDNENSREAIA